MATGNTLYVRDRKAWRAWLSENHAKKDEIWLIYPRKNTGKPRLPYADAVEEALCFGWIDSNIKGIDENSYAQRFSRRKKVSVFSQPNIERVKRMIKLGKMTPAGITVFKNPEVLGREQKLEIAPDVREALKEDRQVWTNFRKFPEIYKRIRIAYIEGGRRHGDEEFLKRLRFFIKKTKKNKSFGFGGVQKEDAALGPEQDALRAGPPAGIKIARPSRPGIEILKDPA